MSAFNSMPVGRKPTILLVCHGIRSIDPGLQKHIFSLYDIIDYDCESVEQCIERMAPGGLYSEIDGIVRTGWLKCEPFQDHVLFRGPIVDAYPKSLRLICCTGHGYDVADIPALTARGIIYCNTPDACTVPVANTAISLILNAYRYFTFADHCIRTGRNGDWEASRIVGSIADEPFGQNLGVIGLGDIGQCIARKASTGLDMKIHYFGPRRKEDAEATVPGGAVYHNNMESLLKVADCVVIACPLTKETYHLLSFREFELAKPGLRVVNIARGKIIDEEALVDAIRNKKVASVGLDVHEHEPQVNEFLRKNHLVTLLPHVGVCSKMSWDMFEKKNWENVERFFLGSGTPKSPVNWKEVASQHENSMANGTSGRS